MRFVLGSAKSRSSTTTTAPSRARTESADRAASFRTFGDKRFTPVESVRAVGNPTAHAHR